MPEQEKPLLQFKIPEYQDVEIYLVRLKDGTVVARTKEELAKLEAVTTVISKATRKKV